MSICDSNGDIHLKFSETMDWREFFEDKNILPKLFEVSIESPIDSTITIGTYLKSIKRKLSKTKSRTKTDLDEDEDTEV